MVGLVTQAFSLGCNIAGLWPWGARWQGTSGGSTGVWENDWVGTQRFWYGRYVGGLWAGACLVDGWGIYEGAGAG